MQNINDVVIKFRKTRKHAIIPTFATDGSAGFDFYAIDSYLIPANEHILIPTGLCVEMPASQVYKYEMQIRPRSGLALQHKITVLNSPGTIDFDYRGEIKIMLINFGEDYRINANDRIAQGIITQLPKIRICQADSNGNEVLPSKLEQKLQRFRKRNVEGFGSTGR